MRSSVIHKFHQTGAYTYIWIDKLYLPVPASVSMCVFTDSCSTFFLIHPLPLMTIKHKKKMSLECESLEAVCIMVKNTSLKSLLSL